MNRLSDRIIPQTPSHQHLPELSPYRHSLFPTRCANRHTPVFGPASLRLLPLLLMTALLLFSTTGCGRGSIGGTGTGTAASATGTPATEASGTAASATEASATAASATTTADTASSAASESTAAEPSGESNPAGSGPKFPDFTLKDINGNTVDQSVFANHALTMVNVWGTFCGPCIREMPDLGKLARELEANHDATVLGIVVDIQDADTLALARQITTDADAGFTHLVPGADLNDFLSQFEYIPTTVFVDRSGHLVGETIVGGNSYDDYLAMVTKLLAP